MKTPPIPPNSKFFTKREGLPNVFIVGAIRLSLEYLKPGDIWRFVVAAVAIEEWRIEQLKQLKIKQKEGIDLLAFISSREGLSKSSFATIEWSNWRDEK